MIENTGKPVPRPWRWSIDIQGKQQGFAATKREARQQMFAVMGLMPEGSEARKAYLKRLGIDDGAE